MPAFQPSGDTMKIQHVSVIETSARFVPVQSFLSSRVTMALCLGGLDTTNIGVSTLGSTVTLSGEVAAAGDLLIAEGIARGVLGVSSVRNRLVTNRAIIKPSASSVGPIR